MLLIIFVLLTMCFINFTEKKKSKEFLEWIVNNSVDIYNGNALYKDIKIDEDTEIVQFKACISFIIVTFKITSGHYVKGNSNTALIGGIYSLTSLVLGWWGIPWGPIYTIQVVASNISGSNSFKVKSMLPSKNPSLGDPIRIFNG